MVDKTPQLYLSETKRGTICPFCKKNTLKNLGYQGYFEEFYCPEDGYVYKLNGEWYSTEDMDTLQDWNYSIKEALEEEELNPTLWIGNQLKPAVHQALLNVVKQFQKNLHEQKIDIDIDDVLIVGSNANYNYTKYSDLDLHIVADVSKYQEYDDLALKLYQAQAGLFNNKYDPVIKDIEIEIYVEPSTPVENVLPGMEQMTDMEVVD